MFANVRPAHEPASERGRLARKFWQRKRIAGEPPALLLHGPDAHRFSEVAPPRWLARFAAITLLLIFGLAALAQPKLMFESIKNYTAPEFFPAPDHTKLRTLVKGAVAEPAGPGRVLLKQVRIERFLLDGSRELLIEAPECIYHIESKEVTSTGPVAAKSGDDRYQLSGVGFRFLYRGTNSSLIISNNVRTTILGMGVDALKP